MGAAGVGVYVRDGTEVAHGWHPAPYSLVDSWWGDYRMLDHAESVLQALVSSWLPACRVFVMA